jgi:predicted phosphodiesterase
MSNLFKKAAVFTDLHLGNKGNSLIHNQDCEDFVDWFIQKAKQENCETCLFLGDWHHHRASLNVHSLSFSVRLLEKLNDAFDRVFVIPGNHDLYYRDKREVHSVEWAKHLPNITIINDWFKEGDVVISPWLVGDDHKKLMKMKGKYLFGHFELPNFYMNAQVLMPDNGEVSEANMKGFELVFSGHFHKRQARSNIWYIGNAFPHNYADAGDDARGMMILKWGEEPEFHSWPNQPTFRVYKLSDVLDNPEGLLLPNSHVRVHLDIDISYEEASFIRETLIPTHNLREMALLPIKGDHISPDTNSTSVKFESVDQIVMEEITNIKSDFYDTKILMDIYRNI